MRPLLCSAIALLALATVCSGCLLKPLVPSDGNKAPKGCEDEDGKMHAFGSQWIKDCKDCSCSRDGMRCCDMLPTSTDIPSECELVVDKANCKAKMVLKSDKSKDCDPV